MIEKVDLSSLELRLHAMWPKLQGDPYREAAARMFNVQEEDVTVEQRTLAKQALRRAVYSNGMHSVTGRLPRDPEDQSLPPLTPRDAP
jgi:DNA polymerase I - 3''-5'' exonuclease and polymerase domains